MQIGVGVEPFQAAVLVPVGFTNMQLEAGGFELGNIASFIG